MVLRFKKYIPQVDILETAPISDEMSSETPARSAIDGVLVAGRPINTVPAGYVAPPLEPSNPLALPNIIDPPIPTIRLTIQYRLLDQVGSVPPGHLTATFQLGV